MKNTLSFIALIFFVALPLWADESIFPIKLSYDTGISHIYSFEENGRYSLVFEANEARGFEGGTSRGSFTFEADSNGGGTLLLQNGSKITFRMNKKLASGESIETEGMVYDESGSARYLEAMPILIERTK